MKLYSWLPIQTSGLHIPTPRVGHTVNVLYDGDVQKRRPLLLLLGGADPKTTFNEASLLDVNSGVWFHLPVPQEIKSPRLSRYEHASSLLGDKEIFVFGGATKEGPLSDISCLLVNHEESVNTAQQQAIPAPPNVTLSASSKIAPPFPHSPRTQFGSSCTTELGQFLVFAGAGLGSEPVLDSQVHLYDSILNVWKTLKTDGDIPEARFGHLQVYQSPNAQTLTSSAGIPGGKLYLHGGMAGNAFFEDVFELTFGSSGHEEITATWRKLFPVETTAPFVPDEGREVVPVCEEEITPSWARAAHGGAILPMGAQQTAPAKLFIFGGLTQTGPVNDVSYCCLESGQWTQVECSGSLPAARFDFAYCLFASSGLTAAAPSDPGGKDEEVNSPPRYYFFIHGGMNLEGTLFNDCMALELPGFDET